MEVGAGAPCTSRRSPDRRRSRVSAFAMNPRRAPTRVRCAIVRISARTSAGTVGRPMQRRLFQAHYSRKPRRCQAMTVSGSRSRAPFAIRSRCARAGPRTNGPPLRAATAANGCAATPAVGAVTPGLRAGARHANAPMFARSGAPTSSARSVSIGGRNINGRNKNGLFSMHTPVWAFLEHSTLVPFPRPSSSLRSPPVSRSGPAYFASGSGRTWNLTSLLVVPLPPSSWNGARVA
jgi:hypothetical protein